MPDAAPAARGVYKPRRSQASPLFRLVSDHLAHRTLSIAPDAPTTRGDVRRARWSPRGRTRHPIRPVCPTGTADRTACEARPRGPGHATAHPPVLARSASGRYTRPTPIEIPIPSPGLRRGSTTSTGWLIR